MFKKLALAAAVTAAFSGAVCAQSSVTIYGRVNVTGERQKINDESSWALVDNASRVGFKGSEDLGQGLQANFVIEHGFDATNGTQASGAFWDREATVGLSGEFGAVRLGNMPASEAYFGTADYVSLHNHDTGTSADALYALGFSLATGRMSNAIAYTSPVTNGFRVDVQVGLQDAGDVDRRIVLAGNYDAGPLHVGVGYEAFNGIKALVLRGLYEYGAFTFGGYIERDSGSADVDAASNALLADDASRTAYRLSVMYKVGAGEVHGNVGMAGDVGDTDGTDGKQYTVAYNYNLSTRTKVYAFYTKREDNAGLYFGDVTSIAGGIRHNF